MAPSYGTECKVLSRATNHIATRGGTSAAQTPWGSCCIWKDEHVCQPTHSPVLVLAGHKEKVCSNVSILLPWATRPQSPLPCTTGELYPYCFLTYQSIIQSQQRTAHFSTLPLLGLLTALPNAVKYKHYFMIAQKFF